jgi:hypothetical protein
LTVTCWNPTMLLFICLFQHRIINKMSYHVYVCLEYRFWLCSFSLDFWRLEVRVMVFNAAFSSIVAVSFIGGGNRSTGRNHQLTSSHWKTLSHKVVSSTPRLGAFELTTLVVIGTECTDSCKSNYHTITTAPRLAFGTVQRVWCFFLFIVFT